MYYQIQALDDYIIRFYRNGISTEYKPTYTWEKPLYYQIYNKNGDLIADKKVPKNWFFPRGVKSRKLLLVFL